VKSKYKESFVTLTFVVLKTDCIISNTRPLATRCQAEVEEAVVDVVIVVTVDTVMAEARATPDRVMPTRKDFAVPLAAMSLTTDPRELQIR